MGPQFFVDGGFVCTYKGITRLLGKGSVRITPARAGKRKKYKVKFAGFRDHPRTHGEKHGMESTSHIRQGSPPHTRGKAPTYSNWANWNRITPAHTGKSFASDLCGESGRDHPRSCGEKLIIMEKFFPSKGSPPRVRGKGGRTPHKCKALGITPARAGKRSIPARLRGSCWDHPRACGEKPELKNRRATTKGSPPRVRGKAASWGRIRKIGRITPARAGKRQLVVPFCPGYWDHPRACGEKAGGEADGLTAVGSPPHTRGKETAYRLYIWPDGITPAHAGKRWTFTISRWTTGDHPRTRGEKTKRIPILSHCFQAKGSFSFSFS